MVQHTLHFGQDVLLLDKSRKEHAVIAGLAYGKTAYGPKWCLKRCLDNPRVDEFIVIAPTYKLARDRYQKEFADFLRRCGFLHGKHFRAYRSTSDVRIELMLPGCATQQIYFLSADAPESIVSYNAGWIWADEPALFDYDAWFRVQQRLRNPNSNYQQVLFTGTPEGSDGWFADRFSTVERRVGTVFSESAQRLILHGRTRDNPYISTAYVEMLEKEYEFDPARFATYLLGEFVSLSKDRFYFAFDERSQVGDYPPQPENKQIYLCWDNNLDYLAWVALQPTPKGFKVVKDNGSRGRNLEEGCIQFIESFPPHTWGDHAITVLGDPALWERSVQTSTTGYEMIRAMLKPYYPRIVVNAARNQPSVEERNRTTNKALYEGALVIDRNAKAVLRSLKVTELGKYGKVKKGSGDTHSHAMEAIDQALMVLRPCIPPREFHGMKF